MGKKNSINKYDPLKTFEKFKKLKILVIGDAMLDSFVSGKSRRISREAPVAIIDKEVETNVPGGAANTAVNTSLLGAKTFFISVVGKDEVGNLLIKKLKKSAVNNKYVLRVKNRKTLFKQRINSEDQMIARLDSGTSDTLDKESEALLIESLTKMYEKSDGIIISDYNHGVITKRIVSLISKLQKKHKKIVAVDSPRLDFFSGIKPYVVKPNFAQALRLLGKKRIFFKDRLVFLKKEKAKLFDITKAQNIALSLDKDGVLLMTDTGYVYKTQPEKIHDNKNASGAGDTFTAAITLSLCAGTSFFSSGQIGQRACDIVLKEKGTTAVKISDLKKVYYQEKTPGLAKNYTLKYLRSKKNKGKRIVFTNGCFDILHIGHTTYLKEAKKLGDILVVGVNSDASVRRLKGETRPVNNDLDRAAVLKALDSVDETIIFSENTPVNLIGKIKPHIFVKGGDYSIEDLPEAKVVEGYGGKVKILPFVKNRSTTKIIRKIKRVFRYKPLHANK